MLPLFPRIVTRKKPGKSQVMIRANKMIPAVKKLQMALKMLTVKAPEKMKIRKIMKMPELKMVRDPSQVKQIQIL